MQRPIPRFAVVHATCDDTLMNTAKTPLQRVVLLIGSIGPLGHLPASGTITVALLGIPLFWVTSTWPTVTYLAVLAVFIAAAVWVHATGDKLLGEQDSRKLVWDELAGFAVAVTWVPFTWQLAVLAFVMERLIDIVKVPPADWIDERWHGGVGVVADDVVAGIYTCALLHVAIHFAPSWLGL